MKKSILMLIMGIVVGLGLTFGVYYFFFKDNQKIMECPKCQECEKCTETKCEEKECPKCEECKKEKIDASKKMFSLTKTLNGKYVTLTYYEDGLSANLDINGKVIKLESGAGVYYDGMEIYNDLIIISYDNDPACSSQTYQIFDYNGNSKLKIASEKIGDSYYLPNGFEYNDNTHTLDYSVRMSSCMDRLSYRDEYLYGDNIKCSELTKIGETVDDVIFYSMTYSKGNFSKKQVTENIKLKENEIFKELFNYCVK